MSHLPVTNPNTGHQPVLHRVILHHPHVIAHIAQILLSTVWALPFHTPQRNAFSLSDTEDDCLESYAHVREPLPRTRMACADLCFYRAAEKETGRSRAWMEKLWQKQFQDELKSLSDLEVCRCPMCPFSRSPTKSKTPSSHWTLDSNHCTVNIKDHH